MGIRQVVMSLCVLLAIQPAWSQGADPGPTAERAFVVRLQDALRANDRRWIADHVR